ncbi:MAG: ketol-acid reductoisomerase, partial [Pyrinomonadaceae bacterium]
YGDMTRGPAVINDETKLRMKGLLAEIQSGAFAREWVKENQNGRARFQELENKTRDHQIERVGAKLREMMPWLAAGRLVDKARN